LTKSVNQYPKDNGWVRYVVGPESTFFPVLQKYMREVKHGKESLEIASRDGRKHFKFVFDWVGENQCGIEVFRKIGE